VFNGTTDFKLANGSPARFIFDTEDGTISGWNGGATATIKVDKSKDGVVYKGLALAASTSGNRLYAANFSDARIDVFDGNWDPVPLAATAFQDPRIPMGFAPFNVQTIGGLIYVTFAMQGEMPEEVDGPGLGYVDAFTPDGVLVRAFEQGGFLNAPWGVAMAPLTGFGKHSGHLLVGQFGSGRIATYDPVTGAFTGFLLGPHGPLTIDGLWALDLGTGGSNGPANTLFFTAGIDDEQHGLFGTITPIPGGANGQN
jgi:uncharacterized protein (TIGR03118 family)